MAEELTVDSGQLTVDSGWQIAEELTVDCFDAKDAISKLSTVNCQLSTSFQPSAISHQPSAIETYNAAGYAMQGRAQFFMR